MTLRPFLLGSVTILFIAAACAQTVRPMQTRDVTRLSQLQISEYLKHKDVIFVAVGATESQGGMPSDREYVAPLGSAAQMAEETDAVYMPNLAYFYPGSTITSSATVYVSIPLGEAYLKAIAHSLLRQGFKTQIWVWHGHGPAPLYVGAMVRDFFEETHVPILSIDGAAAERAYKGEKDKVTYAKYAMVGHLEDIPLASEVPSKPPARGGAGAEDPGLGTLSKMGLAGSLALGYWWADPEAHSAGMGGKLPTSAAEREAWAKIGKQQLTAIVKTMDLKTVIAALQEHTKFTEDNIVPKFKSMLPESQK